MLPCCSLHVVSFAKSVNDLRKHANPKIKQAAKALRSYWKKVHGLLTYFSLYSVYISVYVQCKIFALTQTLYHLLLLKALSSGGNGAGGGDAEANGAGGGGGGGKEEKKEAPAAGGEGGSGVPLVRLASTGSEASSTCLAETPRGLDDDGAAAGAAGGAEDMEGVVATGATGVTEGAKKEEVADASASSSSSSSPSSSSSSSSAPTTEARVASAEAAPPAEAAETATAGEASSTAEAAVAAVGENDEAKRAKCRDMLLRVFEGEAVEGGAIKREIAGAEGVSSRIEEQLFGKHGGTGTLNDQRIKKEGRNMLKRHPSALPSATPSTPRSSHPDRPAFFSPPTC
jgi:hypothetical protein